MRAFLIVLDSVGIGAAPDAEQYNDAGSNTLAHIAASVGGLSLPALQELGLGNIPLIITDGMQIEGVATATQPTASYGTMREVSKGKDTTTGHWEMTGIELSEGFHIFPANYPSFPSDLIEAFISATGREVMGNMAASGTEIIKKLGPEQMENGAWIVYTSADSVFQIAAHEEIIPLNELYAACLTARQLCDKYFVGRVIARPYIGKPGNFQRTQNRRDYSIPPPEPTILNRLTDHGIPVITVGKLDDVFANRGITRSIHVENNPDAIKAVLALAQQQPAGLVFANLIDFDMLYGHRRNAAGYAKSLEDADRFIKKLVASMHNDDLLIITADHGNDPTFKGTDHTREFVPLLVFQKNRPAANLGIRNGFFDIAQSLADYFKVAAMPRGKSFLSR